MKVTKQNLKKSLMLDCRYYRGEKEDPFQKELQKHEIDKSHLPPPACMISEYDLPIEEVDRLRTASWAWGYERGWVASMVNGEYSYHVDGEFLYHLGTDFAKGDGTPICLKSIFYNRYVHWALGDYMGENGLQKFKNWYESYASRPTWRQERIKERGEKLLARCHFYKGEKENPWEYCYTELLRRRKVYWYIERSWFNSMIFSYKNATTSMIEEMHLADYFKHQDIPASLMEMIISYDMYWAKKDGKKYRAAEALLSYEQYMESIPLGDGVGRYLSFFKGEECCPYPRSSEDFREYFWGQEKTMYGRLKENPLDFDGDYDFLPKPDEEDMDQYVVDAWMFDGKYPIEQRFLWEWIAENYLGWVPYRDALDSLCEQYIGFHYEKGKRHEEQDTPVDLPLIVQTLLDEDGFECAGPWDDRIEDVWGFGFDPNGIVGSYGAPELYVMRDEMLIYVTEAYFTLSEMIYNINKWKEEQKAAEEKGQDTGT